MKFKTTALVLALGALSQANAAMYNMCKEGVNMVPCEAEAWDIGVDALHLKNVGNFFDDFIEHGNNFDPDYGWGVRVEGSYHFGTGNDITINWAHISKASDGTDNNTFFDEGVNINFEQKAQFHIFNAEFGQHLDFGDRFNVRAHFGFQYADLKETYNTRQAFTANNVTFAVDDELMHFASKGWGPRVGLDLSYLVADNFDVFTDVAVAAMSLKVDARFQDAFNFGNIGGTFAGTFDERRLDIASDFAIGVRYTYEMGSGDLSGKVAWEDHIYTNAGATGNTLSWEGVTFGLKWVGNV